MRAPPPRPFFEAESNNVLGPTTTSVSQKMRHCQRSRPTNSGPCYFSVSSTRTWGWWGGGRFGVFSEGVLKSRLEAIAESLACRTVDLPLLTINRPARADDQSTCSCCLVFSWIVVTCGYTPKRNCKIMRHNIGNRQKNTPQGVTAAGAMMTATRNLMTLGAATFGVVTANGAANPVCSGLGPTSATNAARGSNLGRQTAPGAPNA
jgi:hypothetical protein